MTTTGQRSTDFPVTLHDWEHTLTTALLRTHDGNADPIRSFEITPETLARHCGFGANHADEAERAFRRAIVGDSRLYWCLQNGGYLPATQTVPNCMAILALSLLVDSLLDGEYEAQGAYRAKLAQWLGTDRSLMDLRGIAAMWKRLSAWLDGRIGAGAPFRRLVLPDIPKSWTHIGYTRYLSFPTKRDITLLRKIVEHEPSAAVDPRTLVTILDPLVRTNGVSHGLKIAFEDFRIALRSGAATADHRFWRLVATAGELAGQKTAASASLQMEFDEDGERRYRLKAANASNPSFPGNIGEAVASPALETSQNLGPSIRRGVLFFRSSGTANWTAAGEPPTGFGPFHLAVAGRHIRRASEPSVRFECSGAWHVTVTPVQRGTMMDILDRIGIHNASETVRTIELADGIHVGKAWLGLPRYLPRIEGAEAEIDVEPLSGANGSNLACVDGGLRADGPVGGDFAISDRSGRWSRRSSFVPMAEVHVSLESAARSHPLQQEWRLTSGCPIRRIQQPPGTAWNEQPYGHQDMLEALYSSARAGIDEGEAIAIIDRAVGRRAWGMLRTLQESTFLEARPRERWRGRVFTLEWPTLTDVKIGTASAVVVSGALPSRLERDFRETVALQGGLSFRRMSEASEAPPLVGASEVDAKKLADALGWTVAHASAPPNGSAASKLIETRVVGESYLVAGAWDWTLGRFRAGAVSPGMVSLVRLVHPGRRDHDLYRVTGAKRRTFTSRHAAILDAYLQSGRPLFRFASGLIKRIPTEGALPLEVARELRLRSLANGGISVDGWEYTVSTNDGRWVSRLMPGLIEGGPRAVDGEAELTYRRGRGARRPLWIGGRATA